MTSRYVVTRDDARRCLHTVADAIERPSEADPVSVDACMALLDLYFSERGRRASREGAA